MIRPVGLVGTTAALVALLSPATAQISGCADVGCPLDPETSIPLCDLKPFKAPFQAIGVTRIPTDIPALQGLSLTLGASVNATITGVEYGDSYDTQTTVLFNTPKGFNKDKDIGGCALFFDSVNDETVNFGTNGNEVKTSQGTCSQALSESCVSALLKRAKEVSVQGLSLKAACDKMEEAFDGEVDRACSDFAVDGYSYTEERDLKVFSPSAIPITGVPLKTVHRQLDWVSEPVEIQETDDASACWPTLPVGKDERPVITGIYSSRFATNIEELAGKKFYRVMPVLTIFLPMADSGGEASLSQTEAQLTCVKVVEETSFFSENFWVPVKRSEGGRLVASSALGVSMLAGALAMLL
ncbi:hypothetical protein QBC35DRAFT_297153 [Podospora australis]|uniref:Uncharacterized protein n=1 Tax=Podospora australis TaxID=1536484 RepID=A0AAN6WT21_9PEZI|nr:hypothetical protein QBC35DRAFT_297153 [Podospora australis]